MLYSEKALEYGDIQYIAVMEVVDVKLRILLNNSCQNFDSFQEVDIGKIIENIN